MSYIWNEYDEKKYYYVSMESPYLETWDTSKEYVGVNIDIRLDNIFYPAQFVGDKNKINELYQSFERDNRYRDIFNLICHFMAHGDKLKGLTYRDIIEIIIKRDILSGKYGEKRKQQFLVFTKYDQQKLCRYIAKYQCSNGKEIQVDAAIKSIFTDVNLYFEKSTNRIYACINQEKTKYNEELFDMICYFLQDIGTDIEVYWQGEHFGIIEIDETMKLDSVALI